MPETMFPVVPMTKEFMPKYLAARGTLNRDEAFMLADGEGMPDDNGGRRHGGVDIFAPGGHVVRAPRAGVVRRSEFRADRKGPVFGGILAIEHQPGGLCSVMRHVDPTVPVGRRVRAGEPVARVTDWLDGGDHVHYELWRRVPATANPWGAGYRISNCINPATIDWSTEAEDGDEPEQARFHFENPPSTQGGSGPKELGPWAVWSDALELEYATRRAAGVLLSRHIFDDQHWMLEWQPDTYGDPYYFSYADKGDRDGARAHWEARLGRPLRPFNGRENSHYRHKRGRVAPA